MVDERTVRRLKVRGPDEYVVRRAGCLLEDALRTASLPGQGAGLLLVRRLRMAPFAADASPQTVALRLEAGCRDLTAVMVIGDNADEQTLAKAAAVRFRDALSAHLALTRLLCTGASARAWCWPLLVSGFHPELDQVSGLRTIVRSLLLLPEAAVALPIWFGEPVRQGTARSFVEHLSTRDADRLLVAVPADTVAARPRSVTSDATVSALGASDDRLEQQWSMLLNWAATRFGIDDSRTVWVRRTAAVVDPTSQRALIRHNARVDSAASPQRVDRDPESFIDTPDVLSLQASPLPSDVSILPGVVVQNKPRTQSEENFSMPPHRDDGSSADMSMEPRPSCSQPDAAEPLVLKPPGKDATRSEWVEYASRAAAAVALEEADPNIASAGIVGETAAGGLLFLLPVLQAVGLPLWLERNQNWVREGLVSRILARLMNRLRLPKDDAMWHWAVSGSTFMSSAFSLLESGPWRELLPDGSQGATGSGNCRMMLDASGRVVVYRWIQHYLDALPPATRDEMARSYRATPTRLAERPGHILLSDTWLAAARRWLRRRVGIGLFDLVMRRGRLTLTPTHIDIEFSLDQVDPRVRKAGLDIDPGWVPWFGRVVQFHYTNTVD